ncbi:MAG: RNA ligase partner protein [candidate division WOR-3 bacterium]
MSTFVQIPSNFQKFFRVKSPNKYKIKIPGIILYNFVGEMRDRINRGLRVSEKAVREFNDKDNAIRYLRENYRRVMREGIVDSKEDIDTILLAIEQKAILSTADEGQIKLAMELGIEIIEPKNFYNLFL